jgi:Uma2 family endonuclease
VPVTYAAFADGEDASPVKHEFVQGETFAMAGGSPEHAALIAALTVLLGGQLRGKPCRPYSGDLRVRVHPPADLGTYPDLTIVCGELTRDPQDPRSVTNPTLIVEVLSATTEAYDRGDKFAAYRQLQSFQVYLLVSQHEHLIERHVRNANESWTMTAFGRGQRIDLNAIGCTLSVDEVYEGISLQPSRRTLQ